MRTNRLTIAVVLAVAVAVMTGMWYWTPEAARQVGYAMAAVQSRTAHQELTELSQRDHTSALFRAVAEAVEPAVVVVRVKQKLAYEPTPFPGTDDFLQRFFQGAPSPFHFRQQTPSPQRRRYFYRSGLGSGVIVDAKKGYVLTNWHVVRNVDSVEVMLHDGRKLNVEWVRTDQPTDLAVIKVKPDRLIAAPLGDSDEMEVGDQVLAIGAPEGLPQTVTAGIISAKGRTTGNGGYESFLQTDAAINHGNSGGPLVNTRGEVIGINAAIVSQTGVNEGIGLAIPSNMARHVMEQLVDTGAVVRGYLGVTIQNVDEKLAKSFGLPHTHGALVAQVAPDSPAAEASLKASDFIVAVNGKDTKNVNDLRNLVATLAPGSTAKLDLYRNSKKQTVHVKIEKQPASMLAAAGGAPYGPGSGSELGLTVATLTTELAKQYGLDKGAKGVVITAVDPDSSAAVAGLAEGMLIVQVQGKDVQTAEQFQQAAKAAKDGVRLLVRGRNGSQHFVLLEHAE